MKSIIAVLAVVSSLASQSEHVRFHHVHLVSGLDFCARLFEPTLTRHRQIAGFAAIEAGATRLLFGR